LRQDVAQRPVGLVAASGEDVVRVGMFQHMPEGSRPAGDGFEAGIDATLIVLLKRDME
jgi:hypothetical protein